MPKKKKKSRASSDSIGSQGGDSAVKPNARSNLSKVVSTTNDFVDLLSLRLLQCSSSDSISKSLRYSPQLILNESDAERLDVVNSDMVFILSTPISSTNDSTSGSEEIVRAAIAQVNIANSQPSSQGISPSPVGRNSRSSKLNPGNCRVLPTSLYNSLLGVSFTSEHDAKLANLPAPHTPSTPVTPSRDTSTPSSSKSKFSFASGGGGDALIASRESGSKTPSTPSSSLPASSIPKNRQLWTVPLDSKLGARISSLLCDDADRIYVTDPCNRLTGKEILGESLVRAHIVGSYLGRHSNVPISFQGQRIDCLIGKIEGKSNGQLENVIEGLDELSLDDGEASELDKAFFTALEHSIRRDSSNLHLYKISNETRVIFDGDEVERRGANTAAAKQRPLLAGLDSTVDKVLSLLRTPLIMPHLFRGALRPPRGVLLHGPTGVGKSCLAKQIAQTLQSTVNVQYIHCTSIQSLTPIVGQAERRLAKIFKFAERNSDENKSGSLIILDDIHLICPRRQGINLSSDRLCATLLALLDGIGTSSTRESADSALVILAITSNPAMLDSALRRPGRLDTEIEVPIPDEPTTRAEIIKFQLESLLGQDKDVFSRCQYLSLARLAKGFTGADCKLAVKEAIRNAMMLGKKQDEHIVLQSPQTVSVTMNDMEKAIRLTKPSAIRSVTVEVPQVNWSSIGGMEHVKQELREAIELPLTHGHVFEQLGIRPPRGVLLYGPPGCSKTLMARALATEGQMNFLAVKGPELLSKWLGESERALASLFKRARLASPSVIFFDEIDAIASKRGGSSSGGERILSQLLTEIDGIQSGKGTITGANKKQRVLVVGATNRPDLLDSALMRPGRIDRMIYVGVPDEESRASIFKLGLDGRSSADDIVISDLAKPEISGGLSGAEVVASCRNAALLALDEHDNQATSEDNTDVSLIRMRHLLQAINGMDRQITQEMLDFYASYHCSR